MKRDDSVDVDAQENDLLIPIMWAANISHVVAVLACDYVSREWPSTVA